MARPEIWISESGEAGLVGLREINSPLRARARDERWGLELGLGLVVEEEYEGWFWRDVVVVEREREEGAGKASSSSSLSARTSSNCWMLCSASEASSLVPSSDEPAPERLPPPSRPAMEIRAISRGERSLRRRDSGEISVLGERLVSFGSWGC